MYKKEKIRFFCDCFRNGYKLYKSRIVLGVVTSYYVSRTKNKIDRIHKKLICLEHFTDRFSGGQRIRCFMNIKTINKCT